MARKTGAPNKTDIQASLHPTTIDTAWAAGVYEGEGTCWNNRKQLAVSIVQKDTWILSRLSALFGGRVYPIRSGDSGCSRWQLNGARARGFAYTIFTFLSPRRRAQIQRALGR